MYSHSWFAQVFNAFLNMVFTPGFVDFNRLKDVRLSDSEWTVISFQTIPLLTRAPPTDAICLSNICR